MQRRRNSNLFNRQEVLGEMKVQGDVIHYVSDAIKLKGFQTIRLRTVEYRRDYKLCNLVLIFVVFSMTGWMWEVGQKLVGDGVFVNRGMLLGPWLPIYGCGGLLALVLFKRWRDKHVLTFFLTVASCAIVEYATSWILESIWGLTWWDYSDYVFNLHGRICLSGLLLFGLAGCLAIYYIAPRLDDLLSRISLNRRYMICTVIVILFVADVIHSLYRPNIGVGITSMAIK